MMVPGDDRGFTLGDGLFETILAEDGRLMFWDEHIARLARGCEMLGLPAPQPEALWDAARTALGEAGLERGRAAVRLTWSAGSGGRGLVRPVSPVPRLIATAAASTIADGPARLILARTRRNEGSPASRIKSLSYLDNILARREAVAAGADEALMLNNRGEVACATTGNVFWIEGDRFFTPALDCGVLEGLVRAAVMATIEVIEVREGPEALIRADAVFLTNSLIGMRAVSELDGRPLGQDDRVQQVAQAIFVDRRGRR